MKKIIVAVFALLCLTYSNAQQKGKFRAGLELGLMIPSHGGFGSVMIIEPKYNLTDQMQLGLLMGMGTSIKTIVHQNQKDEALTTVHLTFLGTYDYYCNKISDGFVPYIGLGLGAYKMANVQLTEKQTIDDATNTDAATQFGGMIRAGFESGKFRLGAAYHYIPSSKIQDINGATLDNKQNSYFAITVGFYLGGGKWKKASSD
ncbi:outer membrane beta-barrel protein [Flavobacterium sp.]|uniref:outer membrane beta-barrel protein n=1 Tax=Flavobacterium sp. TaxID=239 RepID=UPI002630C4D9|nr:outer membrane beta-barrel protein [Flavobacterium sp.]